MNGADVYDEAELATRGIVPVLGGALQAGVTSMVTSSSLQPTRIQIIECPHASASATASLR
jgi:threonine dehydratase